MEKGSDQKKIIILGSQSPTPTRSLKGNDKPILTQPANPKNKPICNEWDTTRPGNPRHKIQQEVANSREQETHINAERNKRGGEQGERAASWPTGGQPRMAAEWASPWLVHTAYSVRAGTPAHQTEKD